MALNMTIAFNSEILMVQLRVTHKLRVVEKTIEIQSVVNSEMLITWTNLNKLSIYDRMDSEPSSIRRESCISVGDKKCDSSNFLKILCSVNRTKYI
jgi:hypothetical protein